MIKGESDEISDGNGEHVLEIEREVIFVIK